MLRLLLLYAGFAILALAIETAVPHLVPIRAIVPNLIVILAVDLGLRHHGVPAALMAFAMGYATDALSGAQFGSEAFMITLVYLASYEISLRLMVTSAAIGAMIVLLATPITALGALALSVGAAELGRIGPILPWLVAQSVVSALVAPVVFALLTRTKRLIGLPAHAARE